MRLKRIHDQLLKQHGRQHWWPADSPFEVMVGAILTQNTAWTNVERAIDNLKQARALSVDAILASKTSQLANWLKPSGYFNIKAERLRNFCDWYREQGGYESLKRYQTSRLRQALLSVKGIGPETADDILLYAFNRKVFVVDAYTKRIFSRLGLLDENASYETVREIFESELEDERVSLFNEYHALIVNHGKDVCKVKPVCAQCCLRNKCCY